MYAVFICKCSIVLALHQSCNLTADFSELFTNIRPRLRIIHQRILNHYNSRESNSNLPIRIQIRRIRIRIEFFHFFKVRIRRIEYSNTPASTFDVILDQNASRERGLYGEGVIETKEGLQFSLKLIYDTAIPGRAHPEEKCCLYICCVLRRDDAIIRS
jgi:hypothetical protein